MQDRVILSDILDRGRIFVVVVVVVVVVEDIKCRGA